MSVTCEHYYKPLSVIPLSYFLLSDSFECDFVCDSSCIQCLFIIDHDQKYLIMYALYNKPMLI